MRISRTNLPRLLIIDDQFGRCSLGKSFQGFVGSDFFRGYQADRENLCRIYGIYDGSGDSTPVPLTSCIAAGVFCPGQRWNHKIQEIENDLNSVRSALKRGWPFKDGTHWALILLDLRFVYGALNNFGDPEHGSMFGADNILPMIRKEFGEDVPVVVFSSTPKDQNNAMVRAGGALDFIQRIPGAGAPPEEGRKALQKVLFLHALIEDPTETLVGDSLSTLKMLRQARRGAMSARNILLLGETGTGKSLLTQFIYKISDRADKPFETFHAPHRPADLQADELFGHWKGAFTGANNDAPGIWERADGGTVFIDEVADIDIKVQQTLMQPIEERKVSRIGVAPKGAPRFKNIDVRVVLATNRDLDSAIANGAFKGDFLNRINAFTIKVPPLREHREDIAQIIKQLASSVFPGWNGKFLPKAMEVLSAREWREGNIRELRNVIERAIANNPDQDITAADVTLDVGDVTTIRVDEKQSPILPRINFAEALNKDLGKLTMDDVEVMRQELTGLFPDLIARALVFALQLTKVNGKLNPTGAIRFLLDDPEMTTLQAKQFLKRLLTLDTQGKTVMKSFANTGLADQHPLLNKLIIDSRRPRRQSKTSNTLRKQKPGEFSEHE